MFYETLLLFAVLALTLALPHVLLGAFTQRVATPGLMQAHFFLVLLAYFVWFWSRGRQTLAMKTWKVCVVNRHNKPLSPAEAFRRFLWTWPSLLLGGIGIFWALIDRDRQFLHDRLAGTRLIRAL